MARLAYRSWGIRAEFGEVSPDGKTISLYLRMSRLRIAWELLRAFLSLRVRVGGR